MEKKSARQKNISSYLLFIVLLLTTVSVGVVLTSTTAYAQASDQKIYRINIPSINAVQAFDRLSEQTGAEFLFPYNLAEQRTTQAINGRYTVIREAAG